MYTCRLPVPWLLYFIVHAIMEPDKSQFISVLSKGLVCSVGMLFIMLAVLVGAIAACDWKMHKPFGIIMILR